MQFIGDSKIVALKSDGILKYFKLYFTGYEGGKVQPYDYTGDKEK